MICSFSINRRLSINVTTHNKSREVIKKNFTKLYFKVG